MNKNLTSISESVSVNFADYIRKKDKKDQPIVKLHIGEPDFDIHNNIIIESNKNLNTEKILYCNSRGLKSLREQISKKLFNINNISADPEKNILITHGAVHAINIAIKAILNHGDECIIIEPYWLAYQTNVILSGGTPIIVNSEPDKFDLNIEKISKHISNKTKLLIINSPNNPSGTVYEKSKLNKLAQLAKENNFFIISDEVYESIVFDGKKHYSIASNKPYFNNIISVFSFSKQYSMTGWRIGYLSASKELIDQILKLSQFSVTCISSITQKAAITALKDPEVNEYAIHMKSEYERRKDLILKIVKGTWLEKNIIIPSGTFYVLINISKFKLSSFELSKKIIDLYNVSFTPGIAFGKNMDHFIRLCFVSSDINIKKGIKALIELNNKF